MNAREWKPGDLAIARVQGEEETLVMRRNSRPYPWTACDWTPGERWCFEDAEVGDVRPLVVIDPEDRAQVERLVVAHCRAYCCDPAPLQPEEVAIMQAALREFANPKPPKPVEPQGLGAVVEDATGNRWVRAFSLRLAWTDTLFSEDCREYADIDAVRVLSEGVTQ